MKLEKFTKNKKQRQIVIGSIIGIMLLIGGISLYRTFAMYKVEQSFNVLNGTVPNFSSGDIQLAVTVDGTKQETIPTKGKNYGVVVSCDHAKGSWNYQEWGIDIREITDSKVKCNLYFESTLSGYIKVLANVDENIIKQEQEKTEQTPKLTDYRYVGVTPNNYVCLESGSCTDDNLYRIIGVMPTQKDESGTYEDRVKLIKNTNYDGETAIISNVTKSGKGYKWDSNNQGCDWTKTTLYPVLNEEYYNSISNYYQYIENAKWYLGETSDVLVPKFVTAYNAERGTTIYNNACLSNPPTTHTIANIGLMYPSDYSFVLNNDSTNNWLAPGVEYREWLISPYRINENIHYVASNIYQDKLNGCSVPDVLGIRPSFYLKKDVLYKSGDGSKENPYKVSINEN